MNVEMAAREMRKAILAHPARANIEPKRVVNRPDCFAHLLYMLDRIQLKRLSKNKKNRWLGWVQAMLHVRKVLTMSQSAAINKNCTCDDQSCPKYDQLHFHGEDK